MTPGTKTLGERSSLMEEPPTYPDDLLAQRPLGAERLARLLRAKPFILIVPALAFLVLGAVLGYLKTPTYTASVGMSVQIGTSESLALADVSVAESAAAVGYSRMIDSDPVVAPVAQSLRLSPTEVASRTSATAVPQTAYMFVSTTGSSSTPTVRLANAMSESLASYVNANTNSVSDPGGKPSELIRLYQAAIERTRRAARNVEGLKLRLKGKAAENVTFERKAAALQALVVEQEAFKAKYQNSLLGPTTSLLVLNKATGTSSNRRSNVELLAFVGLLVGLLIGLAYAALRSRVRRDPTTA